MVTVDIHRVHHSIAFAKRSFNYATVFSVWDRIFGTYTRLTRVQHDSIVFGVLFIVRAFQMRAWASSATTQLT